VFPVRYHLRNKKHVTIEASHLLRGKYRKEDSSPFTRYVQEVRHLDVGERITRNIAKTTEAGETGVELNTSRRAEKKGEK
jgi:hypothetical protein